MPARHCRDARNQVDVSLTRVVVQVLHVSLDYHERLLIVMEVEVGHPGLSVADNLLVSRAVVGCWFVVDAWESRIDSEGISRCDTSQHLKIF